MSMFPHTVTLYNVSKEIDKSTFEDRTVNHITILRGVLLDASKAVNVRTSGLDSADAVNLYIPFGVDATDGVTGKEKAFVGPVEFWPMEDKSGSWTLQPGQNTFFVKGEVVEPEADFQLIALKYDGVYVVTKVDMKDFGGLQHFEVGAN